MNLCHYGLWKLFDFNFCFFGYFIVVLVAFVGYGSFEGAFLFEFGKTRIFHGGDGCPYDGLENRINGCDILILPVNGRDYYRTQVLDIIGCFDSTEAALLAQNCGADLLIPTHIDLYNVNRINPAEFVDKLYAVNPYQKFHIFAPGERYIYQK